MMEAPTSPVRPIRHIVTNDDPVGYTNRILCGTPSRGMVTMEWAMAFRGMVVPPNWSMRTIEQRMDMSIPLRFQVPDAQNIIVRDCLVHDMEWLLLLEDDVIPPPDLLIHLNQYMQRADTPVVSGLYYTKANPSEPLIYRGRGTGSFIDFKMGEPVWCDGVPTGCLLIHHALLKAMWDESEEYTIGGQTTRRVFDTPSKVWIDIESQQVVTASGTSDLNWCTRVMDGDYFTKSGWHDYANLDLPFLVDTGIQCYHITPDGMLFPSPFSHVEEEKVNPPDLGVKVAEHAGATESVG